MRERIAGGYDPFVLPFVIGMIFIFIYLFIALIRVFRAMPGSDRKKFFLSLLNPTIMYKNIRDVICDCLLHIKIFKRNALLGYMHASIAFGWFMLIVLGHIEVMLFVPQRNGTLHYPIFYRYFVAEQNATLKGAVFFFLMDFFLLVVLSGIGLAMYKRIRSTALGMRRTTKPCFADRVALWCLWSIFPLRLLAEGFTAGISGGSFLTKPVNMLFANFLGNDMNVLPTWWAYSTALGLFFLALPFSRYMHIPTEVLYIFLRNAGLKIHHPRKGLAEAEIYSCSSCGLCIDACPMNMQKKNLKYSSVYFVRFQRRNNKKKINEIAEKCLMCGKCVALCPVGVDSCGLKQAQRATVTDKLPYNYSFLASAHHQGGGPSMPLAPVSGSATGNEVTADAAAHGAGNATGNAAQSAVGKDKVLYFAGCMTHLTPAIIKSMTKIFDAAKEDYVFADKDGGVCCGRPLMLAGKVTAAKEVIERNREMIQDSGCKTVVLSCPICLKVLKEEYNLKDITLLHHTQYINQLIEQKRIRLNHSEESFVYHDPCELGRGCNIYQEPRNVLSAIGELKKANKEKKESICCGGSLGSLTLNYHDRVKITQESLKALTFDNPDKVITACPLCLKTFSDQSTTPVADIAQAVAGNLK